MSLTPAEQIEWALTKKLLSSLFRFKTVCSHGRLGIYDELGFLMTTKEMDVAVECFNRLNVKIGGVTYTVKKNATFLPTWTLISKD